MMELLTFFGYAIFIVAALALLFIFFNAPREIAKTRRHSKLSAISVCGWIGLFCLIFWVVAVIWAYTEDNRIEATAKPHLIPRSFDPIPSQFMPRSGIDEQIANMPGRFRIDGVDRETKLDATWYCSADNEANARVKGELEGIVVTAVTRE